MDTFKIHTLALSEFLARNERLLLKRTALLEYRKRMKNII